MAWYRVHLLGVWCPAFARFLVVHQRSGALRRFHLDVPECAQVDRARKVSLILHTFSSEGCKLTSRH